jgi:NADPH-dependent curcumin reductase CurA
MKNRQWLLARRPYGAIEASDFNFVEADAPTPGEGEVLVRNLMLSCDPTQRGWIAFDTYLPAVKIGEVVRSIGAGRIVASNNPDFPVGDIVSGLIGWQDYVAVNPKGQLNKLPRGAPLELAMSALGLTGVTAYFGLIEVGRPVAGKPSSFPAQPARRARLLGRSPRSRAAMSSASRAGRRSAAG